MKTINSEIIINATPSEVWSVISNFAEYPLWNPFIISISSNVAVNNKIRVKVKPVDSPEMTFKPTVLTYLQNEEITWEGRFFIKGLFDGKHTLKLIDNYDGTTTFIKSECFQGLLIPFFTDIIENKTFKGFCLMNQRLKEIVENENPQTY